MAPWGLTGEERDHKGAQAKSGGWQICWHLDCDHGFTTAYMCQNIKLYNLSLYSLLYVNYTSINLFFFFKSKSYQRTMCLTGISLQTTGLLRSFQFKTSIIHLAHEGLPKVQSVIQSQRKSGKTWTNHQ